MWNVEVKTDETTTTTTAATAADGEAHENFRRPRKAMSKDVAADVDKDRSMFC